MVEPKGDDRSPPPGPGTARGPGSGVGRTVALFVLLGAFWLILSGRIGLQYFVFMTLSVGTVLWLNPERPFRGTDPSRGAGLRGRLRATWALVRYLVWLVWNVLKANVEVAAMILHPRLPIRPRLLRFRTTLKDDVARVLVANSITLTPGTVTVDLQDGEYLVHAIHPASTKAITEAELQNVVAPIFGEGADPPPAVRWSSTFREIGR
jgi:multicomponent Na+:H+ antiporter subunit E